MNLKNRVARLEKTIQNGIDHGERDHSAEHDSMTADHLLRIWEGGPDAWVRVLIEHTIENCEGLTPEARANLQERLRILQTGDPVERLLVIADLCKHCRQWSSAREAEVVNAALKTHPAIARAAVEHGILRAGRRDWKAFAWWLERRFPKEYGRDRLPTEDLNRPKVVGAKFSLWAPEEKSSKPELGTESPPS